MSLPRTLSVSRWRPVTLAPSGRGRRTRRRLTRFEPRPLSEYEIVTVTLQGAPSVGRVVWVGPNRILGVAGSSEARFSVFSADGRRQQVIAGPLLGPDDAPTKLRLYFANSGIRVCAWPGRGFAIVNFLAGRIEYYDDDARLVRLARVPFGSEPTFRENGEWVQPRDPDRSWYFDCAVSRDNLFALFSGRITAAYEDAEADSGEFVHVFDWDGNLNTVYRLDRDVRPIVVDRSGRFLYAASLIDSGVYRYDLPTIPKN